MNNIAVALCYLCCIGGEDDIPPVLTNRINNEYSHLAGILEIVHLPIEVPEIKKVAALITEKIKEKDLEPYNALVSSVS